MIKSTLCPLLLVADTSSTIEQIDLEMLRVAQNHLDTIKRHGLRLEISRDLLDDVINRFPWTLLKDPQLKGDVSLWQEAVLAPLCNKYCSIIEEIPRANHQPCQDYQCELPSLDSLLEKWREWLSYWDTNSNFFNLVDRNIGTPTTCDSVIQSSTDCSKHYRAHRKEDWIPACFPWMKIYDARLPPSGEFPFEPDPHWRNSRRPLRGNQGGYLDRVKNEWVWDRTSNDHWNVQLRRRNDHLNVLPEGRII